MLARKVLRKHISLSRRRPGFDSPCGRYMYTEAQRRHYINNKSKYIESGRLNRLKAKNYVLEIKKTKKCESCGEDNILCLDFHHVDRENKIATISQMIRCRFAKKNIKEELDKCICLCVNCHRKIKHSFRLTEPLSAVGKRIIRNRE